MKPFRFIRTLIFLLIVIGLTIVSCRKAFLAQKPSTNILIPNNLNVFQELLDNSAVMNVTPALGEVSSDNYYLTDITWAQLDIKESNAYIWASDIYEGQGLVSDWDIPYQQVFYANTVLDGLNGINPDSTNQAAWNMVKGWALFSRAYAFFNIAELFAKPYDSATASVDLGIPIRLSPDINVKTTRATLQDTYTQILDDLETAESLLPAAISVSNLNRPSKLAVQALLARIYLSIRDYGDAETNADKALQAYSYLQDYNSPPIDTTSPIPVHNDMAEILYQSNLPPPGNGNILQGLICSGCFVDTNLIFSYDTNDLRRKVYYLQEGSDTFTIKGSYSGTIYPFSGLATDELYLIRAECNARAGDTSDALNDLYSLLTHRWRTGTYLAHTYSNREEVLDSVLSERRKELAFRGIRWSDLRRFNQEGRRITLNRKINSQQYSLVYPKDSNLYTLPIPPDVIQLSHIEQNPR